MSTHQIVLIVMAAAVACVYVTGAAIVLNHNDGSEDSDQSPDDTGVYYTVTYVLEGGTNSEKNPETFTLGGDGKLYSPTREGYLFNGWCTDAEHTNIVSSIDTSVEGDVTLYAWWIEIYDGKGYTLSYTGSYVTGGPFPRTITDSGTLTYSYLYYDEELGFYYTRSNTSDGKTETTSKWTSENDDSEYTVTYMGFVECESDYYGKTLNCEVYSLTASGYTETQYIFDGWIPVKIDVQYMSAFYNYTATYTLTDTFDVEIQQNYSVTIYNDVGVTTTGSGTYEAVTNVTLTASVSDGQEFAGWYDADGNLLSTETTYTVSKILSDTVIYAGNKQSPDYSTENGEPFTLKAVEGASAITWEITDEDGNTIETTSATYTFSDFGKYTVTYGCTYNGSEYYGYYTVMADGTAAKTYSWKYDLDGDGAAETFTYTLNILYSDYVYYVDKECSRQSGTDDEDRQYVTSDDKYVKQLAEYFTKTTAGVSDYKRMGFVLAFTQYIDYVSDKESEGTEEYWKFPLETLYQQNGDCEDTSILFCAIASAMNYRSAMLLFYKHMAAAVELPDGSITENESASNPFPEDGVNYYYCETTSTSIVLGTAPSGYEYNGTWYRYMNSGDIIPVAAVSSETSASS